MAVLTTPASAGPRARARLTLIDPSADAAGICARGTSSGTIAEYTGQRQAFGQALLDNQWIQFKLAEWQTEIEALRTLSADLKVQQVWSNARKRTMVHVSAATVQAPRRPTRPTRGSQIRRLEGKLQRGRIKALRGRVTD